MGTEHVGAAAPATGVMDGDQGLRREPLEDFQRYAVRDNLHHLFLAAKVVHHGVGDGRFDLCLAPDLITARLVQVRHSDRGGMSKRAEAA